MKYKTYNIYKIFILFFCVICYVFYVQLVKAQQVGLSISPPLLETTIKPGKTILIAYIIKNSGDPVILTPKVSSFEANGQGGEIKIKDKIEGPVRFGFDNIDRELDKPFFLKSFGYQQLLLRMRVPEGAPEGDYYYTLLAQSEPAPATDGDTVSRARVTIGSNILITVTKEGNIEAKGKIALFDVLSQKVINLFGYKINLFDSNEKIPVVLFIENKGKNLVKPYGNITLKGVFGEKADFEIVPKNILANSQRLINATPSADLECPAEMNMNNSPLYCERPVSFLLSGFFIGKYNLSTTLNFGEASPNLYASASFIAIPFKFIVGIIVAIIFGIIVVKRVKEKEEDIF